VSEHRPRTRADGDPILSVRDLRTEFHTDREVVRAVDGVSFDVFPGETVGIVGESGSGKSVTARSILGLVDSPGRILPGSSVEFSGEELVGRSEAEYRRVRGGGIAMVFQDASSSLNPVYTVGTQIEEALALHRGLSGREATERAAELLEAVSIPDARRRLADYPHQFSGGQRQRVAVAMALACEPDLLICDEPTTALDVTIQAGILDVLGEIQAERELAIVFVTHDMGVIANVADRVTVMYAGELVEKAPVEELFEHPAHPYTRALLDAIPGATDSGKDLRPIEGDVPTPTGPATDCRFAPRCPERFADCTDVHPQQVDVGDGGVEHTAACLLYPDGVPRDEAVRVHREREGRRADAPGRPADPTSGSEDEADAGTVDETDAPPEDGTPDRTGSGRESDRDDTESRGERT